MNLKLRFLLLLCGVSVATVATTRGVPPVPKSVIISWDFRDICRDVLEISLTADFANPQEVPGPYDFYLDAPRKWNAWRYRVRVTNSSPVAFFRVRRNWGTPWTNEVVTPKIETKTKIQK